MSQTLAERPAARPAAVIEAALNYLGPVEGRPFTYTYLPPAGQPRSNIEAAPHRVAIRDLRPLAGQVSLDREGFAVARGASALRDFDDEAAIRAIYYPESARILQAATGAARVHIFDHTIRRQAPGAEDRAGGARQPVARVHVDHTEWSGPQRVRDLLPEEAEALLRGRVQIVNLWRPIAGPVRDMPLAVCDATTVAPADLVASDLLYSDRRGETYQVRFNPDHRWYWLPEMTVEEALLLKVYDSARDGTARFSPHTAFADPGAPADAPPRQSIELRALLFHPA
ncbi:CmcJ/NvfI family oxidoreductase [Dankookia sp. GCM10030260]|uniref:CmcJ/NvfI family oxidoreductase n=1 Tax=Dankookia sp. GCM10030260 TaxID=3273390 RepID=UPI00361B02D9